MAIYHCSIKNGSRANGQSAVAASAYRSGSKMTDKETGIISDYTRKSGVVHSEVSLCANAPAEYADRQILWNAVHAVEKAKNARLWREFEIALPRGLSRAEQIALVREYVKELTRQGMCVDWSIHDKGDGNPHAHLMATTRSILPNGEWAPKSRKVYDLDENGNKIYQGKDKTGRRQYKNHKEDYNNWNDKERIEEWRAAWAECCNRRLPKRDRIDHRSYERQGKDQIPTVHEGYVARQMEKRVKGSSEIVSMNEEIRRNNRKLRRITDEIQSNGEEKAKILADRETEVKQRERFADILARRNRPNADSNAGAANGDRDQGRENLSTGTTNYDIRAAEQQITEFERIENEQRIADEAARKRQADIDRARAEQAVKKKPRRSGPSL